MSTSAATPSNDFEERLANFRARHFPQENIKQVPLTRILAELFRWMSSPIELGELINIVAALQDVRDRPAQPSDDDTPAHFEESVQDSTLRSHSRLEEQAVLRSLWQAVRELSAEQRDVFCLGFEDERGRDLFTVLLEAETVTFRELSQELGRSTEEVVRLWSKMPMENQAIAAELKVTRAQVYKWRFRALERLKKGLLPFSGKK